MIWRPWALQRTILKKEELFILQEGERGKEGLRGLVAPGTGLGMSLMVKVNDYYIPHSFRGGAYGFCSQPGGRSGIVAIYSKIGHVSVERIISGPGLVNIYGGLFLKTRQQNQSGWQKK
jgi:glucokinase